MVETEVLETGKKKDGTEFEVRAKEWFNLIKKDDGTIGWSENKKANLNNFLKSMRVEKPSELVGKQVSIKVVTKEDNEGNEKTNLRFVY